MIAKNPKKIITGLHVLGEIYSKDIRALKSMPRTKKDISKIIKKYKFTELGSFYHKFPSGGFTGIVSLIESHVTIHTWPELNYVTLDVYICSYSKNNDNACKEVFNEISQIFKPIKINKKSIKR